MRYMLLELEVEKDIDISINAIKCEGGRYQAMHDGQDGWYDMILSSYALDDFPGLFRYVLLDTLHEYVTANPGAVLYFDEMIARVILMCLITIAMMISLRVYISL